MTESDLARLNLRSRSRWKAIFAAFKPQPSKLGQLDALWPLLDDMRVLTKLFRFITSKIPLDPHYQLPPEAGKYQSGIARYGTYREKYLAQLRLEMTASRAPQRTVLKQDRYQRKSILDALHAEGQDIIKKSLIPLLAVIERQVMENATADNTCSLPAGALVVDNATTTKATLSTSDHDVHERLRRVEAELAELKANYAALQEAKPPPYGPQARPALASHINAAPFHQPANKLAMSYLLSKFAECDPGPISTKSKDGLEVTQAITEK